MGCLAWQVGVREGLGGEFAHLKTYSNSIHGCSMVMRKFGGKTTQERAAMAREPLG